jgi:UDP-N-acetylmuramoyl-tripeptide--D-alanyl-D-alanine ligase
VGTNHPGELKPLLEQVQPNFGVITSIGREHLEYFGSLEGVAEEEGMVASMLPSNGCLFINAEIPFLENILGRTSANQVLVGRHPKSQWNPVKIKLDAAGVEFEVAAADSRYSGNYRVNLVGRHQVTNALLALAVGARLGMPKEALAAGLLSCQAVKLRMNVTDLAGVRILDDCYNANADSMRAALETLVELPCAGRRVALLGDMAELGLHCREAHQEVGRRAAELGVNWLMGVGSMSQVMVEAAHRAGMAEAKAFLAVEEAAKALKNFVRPGDMVLIKASRVMRLERISDLLQGRKN